MASVNKVILVGNLGKDPESRTFPNGDAVCNVTIATTDKWKDKANGEMREATEWHRLQFSGKLAEIAQQYLRKGSQIYVEGQIRTRKYTDKDGVEKYATDIRVNELTMLGSRKDGEGSASGGDNDRPGSTGGSYKAPASKPTVTPAASRPVAASKAPAHSGFDDMDDDIPF